METNVKYAGKSEDMLGDYEKEIAELVFTWPDMAIRLCGEDVRSQPASIVRPLCGSQHAEEIFVESDVGSTDDAV